MEKAHSLHIAVSRSGCSNTPQHDKNVEKKLHHQSRNFPHQLWHGAPLSEEAKNPISNTKSAGQRKAHDGEINRILMNRKYRSKKIHKMLVPCTVTSRKCTCTTNFKCVTCTDSQKIQLHWFKLTFSRAFNWLMKSAFVLAYADTILLIFIPLQL